MARSLDEARALCRIGPEEEALLASAARPIVVLDRRPGSRVAEETAPRQTTLGIMLAYTPLHHLLLHDAGIPLVMTSGNRSDEPIAYRDDEALAQLGAIADYFLTHNRPIHMRCDDSVARVLVTGYQSSVTSHKPQAPTLLRRSRGYAPAPLRVASRFGRHLLACGGELKNTFCVAKEDHVFLSHHIGDLENYETNRSFREGIAHYCGLFDIRPEVVACDLHPEYLSTKFARELEEDGLPVIAVQHHHAHIASCLADNERPEEETVIGVALDGTGYGLDGAIWGGEFLEGSIRDGFTRRAHLQYLPLAGGEAAIRHPWRMAAAQLIRIYGEEEAARLPLPAVRWASERDMHLIARLLEHRLNTPLTSSAGRLFDTVAALVGVPGSRETTYEGQAAIELELAASQAGIALEGYPFWLKADADLWIVDTDKIMIEVVDDMLSERTPGEIAARFHRTMAEIVVAGCVRIRESRVEGSDASPAVALSGGTFQNRLLLEQARELLRDRGFRVYCHHRVPANDGGLCLGQAALANRQFKEQTG